VGYSSSAHCNSGRGASRGDNPAAHRSIASHDLAKSGRSNDHSSSQREEDNRMKKYMCVICGFVYDEAKGLPDEGIPPGTRWEDIPLNWQCPECGAGKEDFEMMEI